LWNLHHLSILRLRFRLRNHHENHHQHCRLRNRLRNHHPNYLQKSQKSAVLCSVQDWMVWMVWKKAY
jgi:hypothetical protein